MALSMLAGLYDDEAMPVVGSLRLLYLRRFELAATLPRASRVADGDTFHSKPRHESHESTAHSTSRACRVGPQPLFCSSGKSFGADKSLSESTRHTGRAFRVTGSAISGGAAAFELKTLSRDSFDGQLFCRFLRPACLDADGGDDAIRILADYR